MIASALLLSLLLLAIYVGSHRLTGSQTLITLSVFLIGIALIVFPPLATTVAEVLNVGRGVDVVIYFSIVFGLFVTANFYFRFKRDEQHIILLVRSVAISSPLRPETPLVPAASESLEQ